MAAQHQRVTCYSSKRPRHSGHFSSRTKRSNRLTRQRGWFSTETRQNDPVTDRIRNESRPPIERKVLSGPIEEAWVSGLFNGQINLLSSFGHGRNPQTTQVSKVDLPKKNRGFIHGAIRNDTNYVSRLNNEPEVHDWIQREEFRKRKYGKVMMKPGGPGVSVSLDEPTFSRAKKSTKKDPSKRTPNSKLAKDVISPWKRQATTTTVFLCRDHKDRFLTNFPIIDLVEPTWPINVTFPPFRKIKNSPEDLAFRKDESLPKDASVSTIDHLSVDTPVSTIDHLSVDTPVSTVDRLSVDTPVSTIERLPVDTPVSTIDHLSVDTHTGKLDPLHDDKTGSTFDHLSVNTSPTKQSPSHEDTPFAKAQPLSVVPLLKRTDPLSKHSPTRKSETSIGVKSKNETDVLPEDIPCLLSRGVMGKGKPEETSSTKRGWPHTYHNDVLDQPTKHACAVRNRYVDTRPVYCPVGSITFRRSVT